MEAYAVVEVGGVQCRVSVGTVIEVNRMAGEAGSDIELTSVRAINNGEELKIGMPLVEGAKVIATVIAHKRGDKLIHFRKNRRKGYERRVGHRQELTVLKIKSLA
jgi:large subunit ribosomal protein L21